MSKIVTIQDIANELNISRNTVSKALNGKYVPEKTHQLVIEKAIELGYKELDFVYTKSEYLRNQKILLLTSRSLSNLYFFLSIVRGIESTVKKYDFELLQYTFNASTPSAYKDLSSYVRALNVDGIICIESFEHRFIKEILQLDVPVTFIDFVVDSTSFQGKYDVVIMENMDVVTSLCMTLSQKHRIRKFGFVGDYMHCRGFYERFVGMKEALFFLNIPYESKYSLTMEDSFPYGDPKEMLKKLDDMADLPQAFICANDSIAISLIQALRLKNIKVPEQISVVGFDNIAECRVSVPTVTTINTDKEYLGRQALNTLLYRIKHPNDKNRFVSISTNIIYRGSTKPL